MSVGKLYKGAHMTSSRDILLSSRFSKSVSLSSLPNIILLHLRDETWTESTELDNEIGTFHLNLLYL